MLLHFFSWLRELEQTIEKLGKTMIVMIYNVGVTCRCIYRMHPLVIVTDE